MTSAAIDLRDLAPGNGRRAQGCDALLQALLADGFVTLSGHDVTDASIAAVHGALDDVFALPEESKLRYGHVHERDAARRSAVEVGYVRGDPLADKDAPGEPTQTWYVLREIDPAQRESILPPNVWPDEVPAFRPAALELFRQMDFCANSLMRGLEVALGEQDRRLTGLCDDGWAMLRLLRYPPPLPQTPPNSMRSIEHQDIVFLTLYAGATVDGLEARSRNGDWHALAAGSGHIVAAAGHMLGHVTNGLIEPVVHRVRYSPSDRGPRLATPFGLGPRLSAALNPLVSCLNRSGGVSKYPETTAARMLGLSLTGR